MSLTFQVYLAVGKVRSVHGRILSKRSKYTLRIAVPTGNIRRIPQPR